MEAFRTPEETCPNPSLALTALAVVGGCTASCLYNALHLHGDVSTRHVDVWEQPRDAMATCGVHLTETATLGGRIKTSTSGGSLLGTGMSTFGVARHDNVLLK